MKPKLRSRVLAALLSLALLAGLMPGTVFAAGMQSGTSTLTINQSKVAFAGHEWWVIGDGASGVYPQEGHITLLAANLDQEFQNVAFRTGSGSSFSNSGRYGNMYYALNPQSMAIWATPNEYAGSTLQQKMEEIAQDFPAKEQAVITERDLAVGATYSNDWEQYKEDYIDGIAGPGISDQKLWAISHDELGTISDNTVRAYGEFWWLRSPSIYDARGDVAYRGVIQPTGILDLSAKSVFYSFTAARPALSLNLNTVLFTSDASDGAGKSVSTAGSNLTSMEATSGTVKFTMKDVSQTLTVNATTEQSTQTGQTLSFTYYNATTGTNQYVSCVLTDMDGNVKYYGKLTDSSNMSNGNLSVPLTGVADGEYTLQIFSEEANGQLYTDFCSEPVTMTVTVLNGSGTVSGFSGTIGDSHNWSDAWSSNDTHHWHECTVAGCQITDNSQKDGYAAHRYDQQVASDDYLAARNCMWPSDYYYSCICGAKGTETFRGTITLGHSWGIYQSNGNGTHTRTCQYCPVTTTRDCTGGTATCTSKAICSDCGAEYGELDPNTHPATGTIVWVQTQNTHKQEYSCCHAEVSAEAEHEWQNGTCTVCRYPCEHEGGTATCMAKAVCANCGSEYGDINPDNHDPASQWTQENDRHYRLCLNGCGTHLDEVACSGGTATCQERATCTTCGNAYGALGEHALTEHTYKAPTCTETGNEQHWECSTCHALFADAQGSATTTMEAVTIAQTGHDWGAPVWNWSDDGKTASATFTCRNDSAHTQRPNADITSAVKTPATCTGAGTTTYTAKVTFNGTEYSDQTDVVVGPLGHSMQKTDRVDATCTKDGNEEYWTCGTCGKHFSDAEGKVEILLSDTVVAAKGHSYVDGKCSVCGAIDSGFQPVIIAGAGGTWQKGAEDGLSFTSNAAFADFVKVQVDGKDLATSDYEVEEGSTVVTLKTSYLKTLSVGKHTLAIVSDTGTATTEFTIKAAPATEDDTQSPETGDDSNIALWIAVMLAAGAGLTATAIYRRKRYGGTR